MKPASLIIAMLLAAAPVDAGQYSADLSDYVYLHESLSGRYAQQRTAHPGSPALLGTCTED